MVIYNIYGYGSLEGNEKVECSYTDLKRAVNHLVNVVWGSWSATNDFWFADGDKNTRTIGGISKEEFSSVIVKYMNERIGNKEQDYFYFWIESDKLKELFGERWKRVCEIGREDCVGFRVTETDKKSAYEE